MLLAHGNGGAPGVLQMKGAFYKSAAAAHFSGARVPQHTLHAEHPSCGINALICAAANPSKKNSKKRGAEAVTEAVTEVRGADGGEEDKKKKKPTKEKRKGGETQGAQRDAMTHKNEGLGV